MDRRNPFEDVEELVERVDREFGKLGAGFDLPGRRRVPVDVVEERDAVTVVADLPGYDEESITVEFDDDVLRIAASPAADAGVETSEEVPEDLESRSEDNEGKSEGGPSTADVGDDDDAPSSDRAGSESGSEATYRIRERRRGGVSRRVPVGSAVDATGATAAYDAGVLRVTLPKRAAADTHQIDFE